MKTKFKPLIVILALLPSFLLAQPDEDDFVIHYTPLSVEKTTKEKMTMNLTNFDATFNEEEGFVQLGWKLENANSMFIIEHSTDGQNYHEIGVLEGASGLESDYFVFEAREFDPKFNFYRLKQIINGVAIYSNALSFSVSPNDDEHLLELKNSGSEQEIKLRVNDKQKVTIKLINAEGIVVETLLNKELMINEIIFRTIEKGNYEPGDYFLLIEGEFFKQSKKIQLL